ncbi:hypothetical protein EVAR_94077_1 [Eumeta japonica]|uniref:Uncharacterized protein n=1 Tax=Eumeta variegata TaxID=151549 RepID=A0A4C1V7S3_EUMVA|nr:hypothetical protein EVAR_94077_1 [Eumeta japonica]
MRDVVKELASSYSFDYDANADFVSFFGTEQRHTTWNQKQKPKETKTKTKIRLSSDFNPDLYPDSDLNPDLDTD